MSEFAHVLRDLQFEQSDWVQIASKAPGEDLKTVRLLRDKAIEVVEKALSGKKPIYEDFYFGVNPVKKGSGRAKSSEVTRYAAVYLDLDFKEDGLRSLENVTEFLHAFCADMEWNPAIVVHTGGGLQVYWVLAKENNVVHEMKLEAKRFEVMAQLFAANGKFGNIDSISDPTRLFRIPGSLNMKYEDTPKAFRVAAIHTSPEGVCTCLTAAQLGVLQKNPFLI